MPGIGFRDILKSASLIGAGMIFSKAASLLAEVIVARELQTAEFGAGIFAYTILITFSGIALAGVPEGLTYYLSIFDERGDNEAAARTVISGVLVVTVVLSIGVVSVFLIPHSFVRRFGVSYTEWQWVELLSPLIIVYPLSRLSIGIMRGYDKSLPKVFSDDILNKLFALSALGIVIFEDYNILVFLSFYLGQYILSCLFSGGYVIYLFKTKLSPVTQVHRSIQDTKRLMSYSWPLALKNATRRLLGNTDIVLIGALLAPSAVGYYRIGFVISQLGMVPLMSIAYLYTPRVARQSDTGDRDGIKYHYRRATKWGTILTLPLVIPIIYFPKEIIEILFSAEYIQGTTVLVILAIDVLLRVVLGPGSATLRAIDQTKADFAANVTAMILNLGMSYLLIIEFGIIGAALGSLLSILCLNTIQILLVYRQISILPYSPQYIGSVLAISALSIPIFFSVDGITASLFGIPLDPIVFVIIFSFVELSTVWYSGLLSEREKESIRDAAYNRFNLIGL